MTWTNISDQSSSYSDIASAYEIVPDPGFDDPDSWDIQAAGPFIDSSELKSNTATGSTYPIPREQTYATVGVSYLYEIVITRYNLTSGKAWIEFGGNILYLNNGVGTFTNTVIATSVQGLEIFHAYTDRWNVASISITRATAWDKDSDESTTWTDTSTSSSWTPLTDKTTVWS